jgi:inorganic phosphate transporter, PiT family
MERDRTPSVARSEKARRMLDWVTPGSTVALVMLGACLFLALAFEFSNGFHDTANAVATVIYTNSLPPRVAVVWSGLMNFLGVTLGGIAVAYALVAILPPDVLTPPNGNPAVAMLAALFLSALFWNVGTWYLGIPNSSSHALIGSLIGISITAALKGGSHTLNEGVDWQQIVKVLEALLVSPLLGFGFAFLLYSIIRRVLHDPALYKPPVAGESPPTWLRGILILTCTGVSFSHGSNDGQKSIGLIMLAIIGLAPASFAVNPGLAAHQIPAIVAAAQQASPLIAQYGDSRKAEGVTAATDIAQRLNGVTVMKALPADAPVALRNDVNRVVAELRVVSEGEARGVPKAARDSAHKASESMTDIVKYAPWWVRILSAVTLGIGTMIGYRRIVVTLGEKLGKEHLAPAQGAAAELVAAVLIGTAGYTGAPVSTTHVMTSGIAGTMVASGAGVQGGTIRQVAAAWILTLPATILISGGLFWLLS